MAREIPFGTTDTANSVLRHNNDRLGIRVVIDHNAPINRFFMMFRHTGADYENTGSTAGYADGTGGTIRLRICPMTAGGTPNLAATVATETVAAQTLWDRRTGYAGTVATSQGTYFLPRTPGGGVWTHPAGEAWWYVVDNVHADAGANWISFNGVDMRPSTGGDNPANVGYLGPNGVNYPFTPRPAGSFAVNGLDPRECCAWTTGGDGGTWQFGAVGGLAGASRSGKPGQGASTGYYDSPKVATYGWTEAAGNLLAKVGQPFGYNGGGATGTGALRVDNAKRTVTVTHVGCLHTAAPGIITFLNRTTALSSTCSTFTSHNGGAVRRGALAVPVVVNIGDNYEISASATTRGFDPDSSTLPIWDYGSTSRTWRWYRSGSTTLDFAQMLFADPWPDFEAVGAVDTTPPVVSIDMTDGQVVTAPTTFTATATDAGGIQRVDFLVDGALWNSDTSAPYTTQPALDPNSGAFIDEVQRISGTPSASFGLSFEGTAGAETLTTTATAASVDSYLEAFANIAAGGVATSGGPLPTAIDITFSGALVGNRQCSEMVQVGAATGLTIATTTDGSGLGAPGSTHTLTARAFDTAGNSADVTRTFKAGVIAADNTPPVLTVNLGNGQVLTGATNTITAVATDASGIKHVDSFIDGALVQTDTSAPYELNIDATAYTPGTTHTLQTFALDNSSRLTVNQQGVETDAAGFATWVNATFARTTAQAHSGAASLRVTATANGIAGAQTLGGVLAMPAIANLQWYLGQVWVRPSVTRDFVVRTLYYDAQGNPLTSAGQAFTAVAAGAWRKLYTAISTGDTRAAFAALAVESSSATLAGETFDIDDLEFAPGAIVTRTFQAAGTPPAPLPDPCATVEAALLAMTVERDTAVAARDAALVALDVAITERDACLSQVTVEVASPPAVAVTEAVSYTILTSAGAVKYGAPVDSVALLTMSPDERQAVIAAGWIALYIPA